MTKKLQSSLRLQGKNCFSLSYKFNDIYKEWLKNSTMIIKSIFLKVKLRIGIECMPQVLNEHNFCTFNSFYLNFSPRPLQAMYVF